jgi:hypothetical protein
MTMRERQQNQRRQRRRRRARWENCTGRRKGKSQPGSKKSGWPWTADKHKNRFREETPYQEDRHDCSNKYGFDPGFTQYTDPPHSEDKYLTLFLLERLSNQRVKREIGKEMCGYREHDCARDEQEYTGCGFSIHLIPVVFSFCYYSYSDILCYLFPRKQKKGILEKIWF